MHFSFGTSERQWVEAQVENAKQQAILMVLKSQVTSDEAHIHLDLHSLRCSFQRASDYALRLFRLVSTVQYQIWIGGRKTQKKANLFNKACLLNNIIILKVKG